MGDSPPWLTRAEVREYDRLAIEEFGVPGVVLMENAGRGVAELLHRLGTQRRPAAICCGKGNNGGDGFVIARHLALLGTDSVVYLFHRPEELTGDAAINCRVLQRFHLPLRVVTGDALDRELRRPEDLFGAPSWIVDCLFGTGLQGPVRPPFDRVIEAVDAHPSPVLAVDIPSGLDCDTGQPLGPTIEADHTATFVAWKKGFLEPAARPYLGEVHVVDVGVPRPLLDRFLAARA
jgi:NAD(P)H-hydrate epimerase